MTWRLVLLILLAVVPPSLASADEVRLINGDRITGKLIKMEEKVVTIETSYGGELKIKWDEVAGIRTEEPMLLRIAPEGGGEINWRTLLSQRAQRVTTNAVGAGSDMPLDKVNAINLPPVRLRGTATVGGNNTQGNSQTRAVNAAGRLSVQSDRQRVTLEAKYNYGEANQQVAARNSMGQAEYNFFVTPKTYLYGMGLLEKDTFQNLNLRMTFGGGLGYQFVDTKRAMLQTEAGLAYVNEHFTNASPTVTPSSRLAVRWEYSVIPDKVKLFQRAEGYYDLSGGNAMRLRADQGVRVTVYKQLFVNFEYDYRFNSQPAPGRKTTDEAYIFGVGYSFD